MNPPKTIRIAFAFPVGSLLGQAACAQDFTSPRLDAVTLWIGNSSGGIQGVS
jgi:hypothetical protein